MSKEQIQPNLTNQDTVNILKEKIKEGIPFSIIRFGDGEVAIMSNREINQNWLQRACRNWGYDYKDKNDIKQFYDDYGNMLWDTFKKSDIVGIMKEKSDVIKGKIDLDYWSFSVEKLSQKNINIGQLKICEHQICRHKIMGDPNNMKNILDSNDTHIITMYPNRLEDRNLDKILNTNITYTQNKKEYCLRNRTEMLKSFENIKEKIVLLGVGIDKDYGTILRDKYGKITIDMGATIDAWSGIYSRNSFRENQLQSHCFIK